VTVPTGKLNVSYELAIPDFQVLDAGPFAQQIAGAPPWTATFRPSEAGLELLIEIETTDPSAAATAADGYARSLAEHFTFCLCDYDISHSVTVRRLGSPAFQSTDPNTLHVFQEELTLVGQALTVRITRRVKGKSIAGALAEFSFRQTAPTPWANNLVIARQMFVAGLSVENRVAGFLITYAAVAVFATFKGRTGGLQARIDAVLTAEDPTIPALSRRKISGKTVSETEYTAARNDFIHSDERGRDPKAAMATIESLTPKFQGLVGRILRKG
jgi:hypothetical protein